MTKNPLLNAIAASVYIVIVAAVMTIGSKYAPRVSNFLAPIAAMSLFTLSAAVMGYLFCYQPLQLYFDNKKKQAVKLFLQTIAIFGVLTAIALGLLFSGIGRSIEEVHYHAGFLVYVDGVKQDFSDTKYMHVEACDEEGHEVEEDEQLEKAHLHDGVGDVVHVHRNDATWKDLFTNIRYEFPSAQEVAGYVNGVRVENILKEPITKYDSVLFVAGNDANVDLSQKVSRDHMFEVESQSESCGS